MFVGLGKHGQPQAKNMRTQSQTLQSCYYVPTLRNISATIVVVKKDICFCKLQVEAKFNLFGHNTFLMAAFRIANGDPISTRRRLIAMRIPYC